MVSLNSDARSEVLSVCIDIIGITNCLPCILDGEMKSSLSLDSRSDLSSSPFSLIVIRRGKAEDEI